MPSTSDSGSIFICKEHAVYGTTVMEAIHILWRQRFTVVYQNDTRKDKQAFIYSMSQALFHFIDKVGFAFAYTQSDNKRQT